LTNPHEIALRSFLEFLNARSDAYILKGGTALAQCYGLDRESEDIDLDSAQKDGLREIVQGYCDSCAATYRVAKDTDTVERFMIHYNEVDYLKVEVSYRRKVIPTDEVCNINGIWVYKIEPLCLMKCNAYSNRDRVRDMFDISFIVNNFYDQLSESARFMVQDTLGQKGLEQFDYLVATEADPLIDIGRLESAFLKAYERIGLLSAADALPSLADKAHGTKAGLGL